MSQICKQLLPKPVTLFILHAITLSNGAISWFVPSGNQSNAS